MTTPRERLSWKEICARWPNEWVVMTDYEWEDGDEDCGELVSAVVLGHFKTKTQGFLETREMRDRENITTIANWFTGELLPPGPISLMFYR